MIKYLIAMTVLMVTISANASELNGGNDKWPKRSARTYKQHGQPFLTNNGVNYKKLSKHQQRAKRKKLRRGPCNGAN